MGWIAAAYFYLYEESFPSVTDPIDESGWVPDGAFAKILDQADEAVQLEEI